LSEFFIYNPEINGMAKEQKKSKSERKISQLNFMSEIQETKSSQEDRGQGNESLRNFFNTLNHGWQMGQLPLFLFGAKATPINIDHIGIANEINKKAISTKNKKYDDSSVGSRFKLAQLS